MLIAIDPTTGKTARRVELDPPAAVETKLAAARDAFDAWRTTTFAERAAVLRAVAAELRRDATSLAACMTEEMGKVVREARAEVEKCAMTCEHFAEHASSYLAPSSLESDAAHSYVQYLPLGPVLGVLPWNSPFWLAFRVCAPALMAGNTCVIKHDPHVPGCAQALARVFERAGAPRGLVDVLLVESTAVEGIIRDPRIAAV